MNQTQTVAFFAFVLWGCGSQPTTQGGGGTPVSAAPPPVYSSRFVETFDADGVGSVQCPAGSVVTGGGCSCKTLGAGLFGARPSGNSYLCACWPVLGRVEAGVDVTAICLSSNVGGTIKQGLDGVDEEAEQTLASLREAAAAHRKVLERTNP